MAWSPVPGATKYQLQEKPTADTQFSAVLREFTTTNAFIYNLLPDTSYDYQIRALNDAGEGAWTEVVTFRTAMLDGATEPVVAVPPRVLELSSGALNLDWAPCISSFVCGYKLRGL